jgi:thiopurine S-methyltransferase
MLLITIDYDQNEMPGPPFATPQKTIDELFGEHYDRDELVTKDVLAGHPHFKQRGITALSGTVSVLRPR